MNTYCEVKIKKCIVVTVPYSDSTLNYKEWQLLQEDCGLRIGPNIQPLLCLYANSPLKMFFRTCLVVCNTTIGWQFSSLVERNALHNGIMLKGPQFFSTLQILAIQRTSIYPSIFKILLFFLNYVIFEKIFALYSVYKEKELNPLAQEIKTRRLKANKLIFSSARRLLAS